MHVVLRIANGKSNVRQVRLKSNTTIGRSPDCQLKVASNQISRRHCQIVIRDEFVAIKDLGSANGTFVNGRQIPPEIEIPLTPGTRVALGPLQFSVEYELPGTVSAVESDTIREGDRADSETDTATVDDDSAPRSTVAVRVDGDTESADFANPEPPLVPVPSTNVHAEVMPTPVVVDQNASFVPQSHAASHAVDHGVPVWPQPPEMAPPAPWSTAPVYPPMNPPPQLPAPAPVNSPFYGAPIDPQFSAPPFMPQPNFPVGQPVPGVWPNQWGPVGPAVGSVVNPEIQSVGGANSAPTPLSESPHPAASTGVPQSPIEFGFPASDEISSHHVESHHGDAEEGTFNFGIYAESGSGVVVESSDAIPVFIDSPVAPPSKVPAPKVPPSKTEKKGFLQRLGWGKKQVAKEVARTPDPTTVPVVASVEAEPLNVLETVEDTLNDTEVPAYEPIDDAEGIAEDDETAAPPVDDSLQSFFNQFE